MTDDQTTDDDWQGDPVEFEITDELDLHTFHARDVKPLVADYLDECVERGFSQVRIIHGKGTGVLRRIVHAALERHPAVVDFQLGDAGSGAWGATVVRLRLVQGSGRDDQ